MKRFVAAAITAVFLMTASPVIAQPGNRAGQCGQRCQGCKGCQGCRNAAGPRNGTGPRAQNGTCPRMQSGTTTQTPSTPAPAPQK